jgi:hypothetical protein
MEHTYTGTTTNQNTYSTKKFSKNRAGLLVGPDIG